MSPRSIVVIGASAGGLEALTRIVRDLPPELPAAFFVVMHLSPRAKSHLAEILDKQGPYRTVTVDGEMPVEAGRIYVVRPDRHLVVVPGRVFASDAPRENHHRPSVDVLFRSAAIAYGPQTVGVVLSGTLSDGTAGLRWIKRAGGRALVQDPGDALFAGMPTSAIENVRVDHVLPSEHIAGMLAGMVGAPEEPVVAENPNVDRQGAPAGDPAAPSGYVCPDCGGTLFLTAADDEPARYRCRVGHAYSPEGLYEEQVRNLEENLWTAVRAFEENADLAARLGEQAAAAKLKDLAERYGAIRKEALRKAQRVREVIVGVELDERDESA